MIAETHVEKITMIDSRAPSLGGGDALPIRALSSLEQIKQIFGVDLSEKLKSAMSGPKQIGAGESPIVRGAPEPPKPHPPTKR
jgi:hypothetical protein